MKQSKTKTNNRGITLIALIITIVILLILAGIVLGTLKGKNGIIKKADEADLKTTHLGVKEKMEFLALQKESYRDETDFIEYLKSKGYIDDDGIIDMKKVFDKRTNYGNGANEKDVYKIVKDDKYVLNYYDKSGAATEVWSLKDDTISVGDNNETEDRVEGSNVPWIYEENSNGNLIITGIENLEWGGTYNASAKIGVETLKIPSHIGNKKVEEVSWRDPGYSGGKFYNPGDDAIEGVKEIIFPNTIKKISSVISFPNLTNVIIPNSVTNIGNGAFSYPYWSMDWRDCLRNVTIPNSVTSIEEWGFENRTVLTITLEKGSTLEIPANKWGAKDVIREQ